MFSKPLNKLTRVLELLLFPTIMSETPTYNSLTFMTFSQYAGLLSFCTGLYACERDLTHL